MHAIIHAILGASYPSQVHRQPDGASLDIGLDSMPGAPPVRHMLHFMYSPAGEPRWEYRVLWRYGAPLLTAVGLLAMGLGAAGVSGTAISVTLLPLGFICLVTGVVLPRIEGKFTAGPSGLTAEILAVHQLDQPKYVISGAALAVGSASDTAPSEWSISGEDTQKITYVTIGDIWDALETAGLRPDGVGMGRATFTMPDGRSLSIPNRGFLDHGAASDELLLLLASWGVRPIASDKYSTLAYARKGFVVNPATHPRE